MCWAEKCCYVVPANFGCLFVGIGSFILSLFALVTSVVYFIIEDHDEASVQSIHFNRVLGLKLNMPSVHVLLSIVIIIAFMWMLVSFMLVVGVIKNKPNFVLCYFSFGIIITIISQLSALLLLLQTCWIPALIFFLLSLIHIHVLVVVHTVYELMSRGKDFSFQRHQDDEDPLADCFDEDSSRI
ncbi:hypothetical protein PYW07_012056 [Mythimna separata]|uniref:Uncharacterized protein n=1 Tax=Mythimna separata TaxID=271217 RepID=A0AAD8DSA1_MYTSE|nr:hypothetical protein PYW07_012056 [Mythimna separata]